MDHAELPPSPRRQLDRLWAALDEALEQARLLREYVAARELGGEEDLARTNEERIYSETRRLRSAVESTISVGKAMFGMDRCTRCTRAAVEQEMLEKTLAYNFWRLSFLEKTLAPDRRRCLRRRFRESLPAA